MTLGADCLSQCHPLNTWISALSVLRNDIDGNLPLGRQIAGTGSNVITVRERSILTLLFSVHISVLSHQFAIVNNQSKFESLFIHVASHLTLHCNEVTLKIPSSPYSGACFGHAHTNIHRHTQEQGTQRRILTPERPDSSQGWSLHISISVSQTAWIHYSSPIATTGPQQKLSPWPYTQPWKALLKKPAFSDSYS